MSDERSINPTAMSPRELARLLTNSGAGGTGEDQVRSDIAAGAPVNPDGTLNLIHYTAWLAHTSQSD